MKTTALFLVLIATLWLRADDPTNSPPTAGDSDAAPGEGFPAQKYEALWTKSPFAVETPEQAEESPDYSLVGVAVLDGKSYASVIEKQNQQHFLISTDKPLKGLSLSSVKIGRPPEDTTALLIKDGQPITLKLEGGLAAAPGAMPNAPPTPQGAFPQQLIPMPGSTQNGLPGRPLIRIHRPIIHLPMRDDQTPTTPPAPNVPTPPGRGPHAHDAQNQAPNQ